jgi:hypothetical protein
VPIRRSTSTKPTSDDRAEASRPSVRPELQPHSRPFSATSSSGTTAALEQAGAEEVDPVLGRLVRQVQGAHHDDQRGQPIGTLT